MPYYEKIKTKAEGYKNLNIYEYLKNIDEEWCKINTNKMNRMKARDYEKWGQEEHITVFGKKISYKQADLDDAKNVINDEEHIYFT